MRAQDQIFQAPSNESTATGVAPRHLRSLALAWHDEESGDDLSIDVQGSERFLKGLVSMGFRPVPSQNRHGRSAPVSRRATERAAQERVHWTVRLIRHWKQKSG